MSSLRGVICPIERLDSVFSNFHQRFPNVVHRYIPNQVSFEIVHTDHDCIGYTMFVTIASLQIYSNDYCKIAVYRNNSRIGNVLGMDTMRDFHIYVFYFLIISRDTIDAGLENLEIMYNCNESGNETDYTSDANSFDIQSSNSSDEEDN